MRAAAAAAAFHQMYQHTNKQTTDPDPLQAAFKAMHANFELMSKLGVNRWCFHDRCVMLTNEGAD
jgi:xylose isomerase